MRDEPLSRGPDLPAALAAFLRGAERRAFVFLWLQGGDVEAAERALAAAIRAFPGPAERMPMAEWPTRFWKLLLALPVEGKAAQWPPALAFLGTLPLPVRRALLLRQVAGLEEAAAAAVLGTAVPLYQQALAEACPRDPAGAPDAAGWRRQAEAIQQAGRELDPRQAQRLVQVRDSALAGRAPVASVPERQLPAAAPPDRRQAGRGGRRRWFAVAAGVVVLALGAAWLLRTPGGLPDGGGGSAGSAPQEVDDMRVHDNEPVVVEPLPEAEPPAQAPDWPKALPEPVRDPAIAELALLSWYAAGMPASRIERESDAAMAPAAAPAEAIEADAAAVDAWRQLDALEQARLRTAAAALQAQEPAARAVLRARFATLDAMERSGWLLGPALGADYAALQPLVGFVAPGEREPMLAVLRGLTPAQRARLGELAARTPPAGRAQLRRELLATPPAARGAWLEQRVRQ